MLFNLQIHVLLHLRDEGKYKIKICLDIQNLMVLSLSRSYWRNCYIKTEEYKPCKIPDSEQKISIQDRDEGNSPDDCEWNSQNKSQQSSLGNQFSRSGQFGGPERDFLKMMTLIKFLMQLYTFDVV